jgi:hypothetical protein
LNLQGEAKRFARRVNSNPSKGPGGPNEKEIPVKKTAPKKMTLSRETLGILNDKDMKAILGGGDVPDTSDSKNACCANK